MTDDVPRGCRNGYEAVLAAARWVFKYYGEERMATYIIDDGLVRLPACDGAMLRGDLPTLELLLGELKCYSWRAKPYHPAPATQLSIFKNTFIIPRPPSL